MAAVVAVAAAGYWYLRRPPEHDEISAPGSPSTASNVLVKKDTYAGQWVNVENLRERISIRAEGEAFVVGDQGRDQYVGTIANGVLRVAVRGGAIDMLYTPLTDHLIVTEFELRSQEKSSRTTMADIRSIATAWEARATDMNTYTISEADPSDVNYDPLSRALSPTYIREVPRTDGWGNPYQFAVQQDGSAYSIRSFGQNGQADETAAGATVSTEADIVYSNGAFVSFPASLSASSTPGALSFMAAGKKEFRRVVVADERLMPRLRTMDDMRSIATAWEARATDMNTYASSEADPSALTADVLNRVLTPTYIREMPRSDAWGNPLHFSLRQDGLEYFIRSYGENGREDETPPGATVSPEADIIYSNGTFVSWPSEIAASYTR